MRLLTPFLFATVVAPAAAATLPAVLAPPPPFPRIVAQSVLSEFVAPGVTRANYRLATVNGPLIISVVAVDTHDSTVRLADVIANDRLVSVGETVSAMALRTHAIAGINGDYFDIGQTNQPLGIVVSDGTLVRTPSRRVALDIGRDGSVHFEPFSFKGTATFNGTTIPLTAVNEWPPQGGASLLTAAFGPLSATTQDITLVSLGALGAANALSGDYRVIGVYPATTGPLGTPTLALGPAALKLTPPPQPGDTVTIAGDTAPPLATIATAIGGGPALLVDGKPYSDPNAPAPEERNRRFPVSGAALSANGTLYLIAVDGRDPSLSIGLTRPEFGALMVGLGASDGMAFDSGGSSTLVARRLGETLTSLLNMPSDGSERPIADGLFVYSDAAQGPPARLALQPSRVVAVRGARVRVTAAITDAAGHLLGPAPSLTIDAERSETLPVRSGVLRTELPIDVVDRVARLTIGPARPNPDPNGSIELTADAYDASGRPIATSGAVHWTADGGTFIEPGLFHAGPRDAVVTASVGGVNAKTTVRVGRHEVPVPGFLPLGIALNYDFTGGTRIASANGSYALPGDPLSFTIEINGDASGIGLRAAFVNGLGERTALTLAKRVDWRGWQRRTIVIPGLVNPPIHLVSLYAVNSLGTPTVHAAGNIGFRNPTVILPGTP
ncbi:MAG TPA: phosphodiester glycosidase family protein [Candidatus Baltobacteraceae bacterium]|jgi:hypothetical protein